MRLSVRDIEAIIAKEKARLGKSPASLVCAGETAEPSSQVEDTKRLESRVAVPAKIKGCGFVHLHVHTDYSTLDGMCRINDIVARTVELGMPAVAMTDHGNMSGAVEFYQAAKSAGINPIIGCEVYCVPDMDAKEDRNMWHLVLLAKDSVGYGNLMKITTAGYTDGFYYRPRVDLELVSRHSDGLIALSACIAGRAPAMILDDRIGEAESELRRLKDVFTDDLYIELMDHGLPEQKVVNPELVRLADNMVISLVATNDCHYVNSDDHTAHDVLLCIQTGKKLTDDNRLRFGSDQFYLKSQAEMAALFPAEYLQRTMEVAEKCNLELGLGTSHMPRFTAPDGSTPEDYLWERIQQGTRERYDGGLDDSRRERLATEYDIITRTGFASYFLIIDDMVRYAREQSIRIGPGRGSVVASLISYVLGITGVDPVEHCLLFERFLTENRVSPPDIDIDFSHDRREEIVEYLRSKYGYTSQIMTFNRLSPRSIIRCVGKVLDVSQVKIDAAAKGAPEHTDRSLGELRDEIPELAELGASVIDIGTRLHGLIRHLGQHPAGIVVSNEPLNEHIPLRVSKGRELTQYDKDILETCGMLKIDVLGSAYLSVVDMTLEYVKRRHDMELRRFPMDDSATYDLICSGDVGGIFQLGQKCARDLVCRIQPRSFGDLVHLISLGRPGVMNSGLTNRYFEARETGKIEYLNPSLEPILAETLGVILYQEQIMRIAVELAGFTWGESDKLRKGIAKKDKGFMESMGTQFVEGCLVKDISREAAKELWNQIQYFGGYGFNEAHAVGYATLTYQTAYLKAHYPIEYMASLLSVKGDDKDVRKIYIMEARRSGIEVLPPDVNMSTDRYTIVNDCICLPFTAISGLAAKACSAIVCERENGKFESSEDFCNRVEKRTVNKRIRENLVKAGAFDSLCPRQELLDVPATKMLQMEKEVLGMYLSAHPLDGFPYEDGMRRIGEVAKLPVSSEFKTVGMVDGMREWTDRNSGLMAFITIEDGTHLLEVVVFASLYRDDMKIGDPVCLQGRLDQHEPPKAVALDYEVLDLQNALIATPSE